MALYRFRQVSTRFGAPDSARWRHGKPQSKRRGSHALSRAPRWPEEWRGAAKETGGEGPDWTVCRRAWNRPRSRVARCPVGQAPEPLRRIARYRLALPVLPPLQQHQETIVREMFPHSGERTVDAGEVARTGSGAPNAVDAQETWTLNCRASYQKRT